MFKISYFFLILTFILTSFSCSERARVVDRAEPILSRNEIISFHIDGQVLSSIDRVTDSIYVLMPYGTPLDRLSPSIEINGLSISPESDVVTDFTDPVTYLVTAENGSVRQYVVNVENEDKDFYEIGDTGPAGGIIYITPDSPGNDTGLYFEAAPHNLEEQYPWSEPYYTHIGVTLDKIGAGHDNSLAIVNHLEHVDSAANACLESVLAGKDDWFLPSKYELERMSVVKELIFSDPFDLASFYWSSSELSSGIAKGYYMNTVSFREWIKEVARKVRCVRTF